ncbi:MAG: protein kinase [Alphaproteobacteria bacterium]|nr:protein kinase [Alphaproteobacteria bacterium]
MTPKDSLDSFEQDLEGLLHGLDARLGADDGAPELPADAAVRFELGPQLGRGGFGVVHEAWDRTSSRACALKILPTAGLTPEQLARIKREYRAGRRLDHPNVVRTWDLFEGDRSWAFSMELLDGSLRGRIADGPLPFETAAHVVLEVLAGLDHAHAEHVVHRDLKPDNILLGPPEVPGGPLTAKLADFGIARFSELGEDPALRGVTGTPAYMPPEALTEGRFDPRGDLYALALILLEACTGTHPLGPLDSRDWPRRHQELSPVRPVDMPDAVWTLVQRMLAHDPGDRPRHAAEVYDVLAAVVPPRPDRRPLRGASYLAAPPLIGRDDALAHARDWLDHRLLADAPDGAAVLVVSGEAGMGKSRLLAALLRAAPPATVLHGRGRAGHDRPFAALSGVLGHLRAWDAGGGSPDALLGTVDGATAATVVLDRVVTGATFEPATDDRRVHAVTAQRAFQRRQVDALLEATHDHPLLVVVEDLHACDEASLELLLGFAQALAAQPTRGALVLTTRPPASGSPADELLARLTEAGHAERCVLGPLDRAATARLVTALLMDEGRGASLADTLHDDAATPLLLIQTLHLLLARGALHGDGPLDTGSLPRTVQQVVGERVARLSAVAKELLAQGAVLGAEISVAELAACLQVAPIDLLDPLDEAERGGVIGQRPGSSDTYQFVHDAVREALVAGLGGAARALHRRAWEGLVRLHGEDDAAAARIATHAAASGDGRVAWRWGTRAARAALDAHAFVASADLYALAVDAARQERIDPGVDVYRRQGDALLFSGRYDAAGVAYRAALAGLGPDDGDLRILLLGRLAEMEYRASRLTRAMEPLEALLPTLGGVPPEGADAGARAIAALERAVTEPDAPAALPRGSRPQAEVLVHTYRNLAEVSYYHRADATQYYFCEAARLSLGLGATSGAAQSLGLCAFAMAQSGRIDLAEQLAARAVTATEGCGDPVAEMTAKSCVAAVRLMSGRPADALPHSEAGWQVAQRVVEPLRVMTAAAIHVIVLSALGRGDEGAAVAAEMRRLGARYGYTRVHEMSYVAAAAAALASLRFEQVRTEASVAPFLETTGSYMLALQLRAYGAIADVFLGDPAAALPDALTWAERWASSGFASMVCNPDAYALLAGALAGPSRVPPDLRRRLDHRLAEGTVVAPLNRAKAPLFDAAAGAWRVATGDAAGRALLDDGHARALAKALHGDVALIVAARARLGL